MTPVDQAVIDSLVDTEATRPGRVRPDESLLTRLAVLLAAPAWVGIVGLASLSRLLRGRRPLIVLHERVGFARSSLWVPKIATAAVVANERRFFGLLEIATGAPVELDVDGRVEHWLRRTGVDELPQLLLVLAGTMRIVGPRPVTRIEHDEMVEAGTEVGVDFLHPGLVGLWQVLDRHAYLLPERRAFDMLMVTNWSRRLRRRVLLLSLRQAIGRVGRR